jgi:hypothetical protein
VLSGRNPIKQAEAKANKIEDMLLKQISTNKLNNQNQFLAMKFKLRQSA